MMSLKNWLWIASHFFCVSDPIWSDYIIIKLLQLMEQVFSVIGNVAVAAVNDVLNYPFIIEL